MKTREMARQMMNGKNVVVTAILIFICFFIYFLGQKSITKNIPSSNNINLNLPSSMSGGLFLAKIKFKSCMDKCAELFHDNSTKYYEEFARCIQTYIPINETSMDVVENGLSGEKKVYLPLSPQFNQKLCKWLTIGIGGNTVTEKFFKSKYPLCSFYGVDPGDVADFSTIGKVFPFGVGLENSEIELVVDKNNVYAPKKAKVVSLLDLLDNEIGARLIHYLSIDTEGYEYTILQDIVGTGKFALNGIQFCQIDAELHHPKYQTTPLISAVRQLDLVKFQQHFLQESSPYLPIFRLPYGMHQKITFINVENHECEKAFNFSKYFHKK